MNGSKTTKADNAVLAILCCTLLTAAILRYAWTLPWDFCAYSLNARYWFWGGLYFETYRPPVVPAILTCFQGFGDFAPYLYAVFVCAVFIGANVRLSDEAVQPTFQTEKQPTRIIFLFLSLSAFVLLYSFRAGAELLSLAFLEFFLVAFFRNKPGGHWLALAFLTRYNMLVFAPLAFFYLDWRKILLSGLGFVVPVFAWLLYNFIAYGNWFTSIVDSYALNVLSKERAADALSLSPFWEVGGIFWLPVAIGMLVAAKKLMVDPQYDPYDKQFVWTLTWPDKNRIWWMSVVTALVLYSYIGLPNKDARFLFNLSLPIAFFGSLGMIWFCRNIPNEKLWRRVIVVLTVIFLVSTGNKLYQYRGFDEPFRAAAKDIETNHWTNAAIVTPYWSHIHYLSGTGYPLKGTISDAIAANRIVLIFKGREYITADDKFLMAELSQYPVLKETDDYVFLGKRDVVPATKMVYNFPYRNDACKIIARRMARYNLGGWTRWLCDCVNKDTSDMQTR